MLQSKPSKSNFDGFFMTLFQCNDSDAFRARCNCTVSGFECFLCNKKNQRIYWGCFKISFFVIVAISVI